MSAASPAILGRRTCAVLAAGSAVLHGMMLGHSSNPAMAVLMVAMIGACLFCARDLWLRGTLRAWCIVGLMNIAMIAVHMPAPAHHHEIHAVMAGPPSTLMGIATTIAAIEAVAAIGVLYYRTRRNALVRSAVDHLD